MVRLGVISLEHPHSVGNHFPALELISDRVRVSAIYDHDRSRANSWLKVFDADYCDSRDALLTRGDVDAVLITSRNCDHAADSIAAAKAGKDVFCDKPIATSVEDATAIRDAIDETGVRFVTTFPLRFNTSIRDVKKAVDTGRLGRVLAVMATNHGCMYQPGEPAWVRDRHDNGGGCIIDHTVHVADVIRWLTGAEFESVRAEAITALRDMETEDIGILHGTMSNGTIYQIDASWSRRGRDPMWGDVTCRIVGSEGSASLDLYNNQRIEIYGEGAVEFRYPHYVVREHAEIFLDYAECRETGADPIDADVVDGLRTVELVFAAYRSVASGQTVTVNPTP